MPYICKTMCLILQYLSYIKKWRQWHIHTAPPIAFDVWKTASANTTEVKSHGNNSIPAFLWCQAALPWCHSKSPMSPSYGTNETCENTDVLSARRGLINQKQNFRYVWLAYMFLDICSWLICKWRTHQTDILFFNLYLYARSQIFF